VDFARVRRCRQRGLKGLGQPIKSYRDNAFKELKDSLDKNYLKELGPLEKPKKE